MKFVLTNRLDESYCGDDGEDDLNKFLAFKRNFEKIVEDGLTEEEFGNVVDMGMYKVHNGVGDNKGFATVYNISKSVQDDNVVEIEIVYMSSFISGENGVCLCFETPDWLNRDKPIIISAY